MVKLIRIEQLLQPYQYRDYIMTIQYVLKHFDHGMQKGLYPKKNNRVSSNTVGYSKGLINIAVVHLLGNLNL